MRRTVARALTALTTLAALTACAATMLPAAQASAAVPAPTATAAFRWSALAGSPLGSRSGPLVAWDGRQLLEFGGLVGNGSRAASAGAAFDPATGQWRTLAPVPAAAGVNLKDPTGLSLSLASVWTGAYLAVANGLVKSCATAASPCWTGVALYDPKANRWTALTLPKQLDGLEVTAVTWTGRDIVVGAVDTAAFGTTGGRLAVAAYALAARRWQVITPAVPRRHPGRFLDLAYAGGRLLLWSQWDRVAKTKDGFSDYAGVDVVARSADGAWRNVTGSWPQQQTVPTPVRTPDGLLIAPGQIWCGVACIAPPSSEPAYFANPATLARKTIPGGPLGRAAPAYIWAGDAIIALDQYTQVTGPGISIRPGDLALFKPATSRWTGLPAVPGHPSLSVVPVWTGTELLTLTDAGRLFALHA